MKKHTAGHILGHNNVTPKTFKGLLTIVALASLAACGGGEEATSDKLNETSTVAAKQDFVQDSFSVAPSATDKEFNQAASELFVASMKGASSDASTLYSAATEKSKALHDLAGVPAGDTRIKWNPGHYVAIPRPNDAEVLATLNQIKDMPYVKGLLIRYSWRQLEPSKGVYDFSAIDRDLSQATTAGKRLFIMLTAKDFNGTDAVPDYLRTAEYSGGAYRTEINAWEGADRYGENVALYNNNVRDRMIALTKALANRYNRHNSFEGMTFNETALGQAITPLTETQRENWFANLATVNKEANKAFANTVVMQFINFPRTYVNGLVTNMLNNGVALGGPDTFFDDYDINNYVYPHYDTAAGKVPIGPSVQPENYMTTSHNGTAPAPKVQDIYTFGKNRLHANYMFWTKYNPSPAYPYNNVINMFKSSTFPKDSAGGLNRNCPTAYVSCVAKL